MKTLCGLLRRLSQFCVGIIGRPCPLCGETHFLSNCPRATPDEPSVSVYFTPQGEGV
jgi:hypothetical protein